MEKQPDSADKHLWNQARRRAAFKKYLYSFVIVNLVCLLVWAMGDRDGFWPAWVALGMGIGLIFSFYKAYMSTEGLTEREYERLRRERDAEAT